MKHHSLFRRLFSVLLCLTMVFSLFPVSVFAEGLEGEPAAPSEQSVDPVEGQPAPQEEQPVLHKVTFLDNDGKTIVEQQVEDGKPAAAPNAPMVSGHTFIGWSVDFSEVKSDLTVQAEYEPTTALNLSIQYKRGGLMAAQPYSAQAAKGSTLDNVVPFPVVEGYAVQKVFINTEAEENGETVEGFDGVTIYGESANVELVMVDGAPAVKFVGEAQSDVSVTLVYVGAPASYTVQYLFETVAAGEAKYEVNEAYTQTVDSTVGEQTDAKPLASVSEGFGLKEIINAEVTASGAIAQVYYSRNVFTVNWDTGDRGSYVEPSSIKYEAPVTFPATNPTRPGFVFKGWMVDGQTITDGSYIMPHNDVNIVAAWSDAETADYTVAYWGENLNGGYDMLYKTTGNGKVGSNIPASTSLNEGNMPEGLDFKGFELNSAKSVDVTIAADGSAVRNMYFDRKEFTIKFHVYKGGLIFGSWQENISLRITAKYGADISKEWEKACENSGWGPKSTGNTQYTLFANMPAENLTMYEKSSGTGKKIEYRVEKVSGGSTPISNYDVYATFNASSSVSLTDEDKQPIEGFTFDSWQKSGNSPLYLYYTRNSYNINFMNCTGLDPVSVKFEASISSAQPDAAKVGRPVGVDSDYELVGWYTSPDCADGTGVNWNSTMPAYPLTVYAKWEAPTYTVSFDANGGQLAEGTAPITVTKYNTIENQMPGDPTNGTLKFMGWYTDEACTKGFVPSQKIVRDVTLHAKWDTDGTVNYTVIAEDAAGKELATSTASGKQGSYVTVTAPVIEGMTPDATSKNVLLEKNGQEIVFTYAPAEQWKITVKHLAGEKEIAEPETYTTTDASKIVYAVSSAEYVIADGGNTFQVVSRPAEGNEVVVEFRYEPIANPTYKVIINIDGKDGEPDVRNGDAKAGFPQTVNAPGMGDGYKLVGSASQTKNLFADGSTVFVFYYKTVYVDYTVKYVDKDDGKDVAPAKTNEKGQLGTNVTESAIEVKGYVLAENEQAEKSLTLAKDGNVITFYYAKRTDLSYTVKYVDSEGNALHDPKTVTGQTFGSEVTEEPVVIDGYNTPDPKTITLNEDNMVVTFTYTKRTDLSYTVRYLEQNTNNVLATEKTVPGQTFGSTVTEKADVVEGYKLAEGESDTKSLVISTGDNVITFYYTKQSYKLTVNYVYQDGSTAADSDEQDVKFGAEYNVNSPEIKGYTADKQVVSGTMPAKDVTVTVTYTANTDTEYKVEYYFQNIDNNDFTLDSSKTEKLTGTTGVKVDAKEKPFEGFTFDEDNTNNVLEGNIAGDGSLTLKLYYTRKSYTVTYIVDSEQVGEAEQYKFGQSFAKRGDPTKAGYTFSGWTANCELVKNDDGSYTMPAANVTFTGSFTANKDTKYYVQRWLQNANDDGYTKVEPVSEYAGVTDESVTLTDEQIGSFTNYKFNTEKSETTGKISAESALTLNLYYDRATFTVTYQVEGEEELFATEGDVRFGADKTVLADTPDVPAGYHFSGWTSVQVTPAEDGKYTMPANDVEFTGSIVANTDTPYTVEYYFQNIDNDDFTLDSSKTENLTGTTGVKVDAEEKSFEGFTLDKNIEGTLASGNIAGDGSLTLKLYYTRNSYTVKYEITGDKPETEVTGVPAEASYKYGEKFTVAQAASAQGYNFNGWLINNIKTEGEVEVKGEITLTGSFTPGASSYKVEYYFQNIENDGYTLDETKGGTVVATTGVEASVTPGSETGFEFNAGKSNTSVTVKADGSSVIKLYFDRNTYNVTYAYENTVPTGASALPETVSYKYGADVKVADKATAPGYTFSGWSTADFKMPANDVVVTGSFTANTKTSYTVEYYFQNIDNDDFTLKITDDLNGTTDTKATVNTIRTFEGFTFDNDNDNNVLEGIITGDGKLTLKLYYTRNSHNVEYVIEGAVGTENAPATKSYKFGANVEIEPVPEEILGYEFRGWDKTEAFEMPDNDVVIKGSYAPKKDTAYTVVHLRQNLDGNYPEYDLTKDLPAGVEAVTLSGETGADTQATAKVYTGFKPLAFEQQKIAGDGNTVVEIKYERQRYTVSYQYTEGAIMPEKNPAPVEVLYGASFKTADADEILGYTFSGWQTGSAISPDADGNYEMPASNVEFTGNYTANTDTKYTVIHHFQNIENDEYDVDKAAVTESDKIGTTGEHTNATAKDYTGFTAQSFEQETIAGDGSTVVDIYYTRNSYTVTYAYTDTVPTGASALPETVNYKYGAEVAVADRASAIGYTFSGWTSEQVTPAEDGSYTMPAEPVTFTGSFTVNSYPTVVNYYFDGELGFTTEGEADYGTSFSVSPAQVYVRDGVDYALVRVENNGLTVGTENNVINVYYGLDGNHDGQPDDYQTFFNYIAAGNGAVTGTVNEVHTDDTHTQKPTANPRAEVTATPDEGYAFASWTDSLGNTYGSTALVRAASFNQDVTFTANFAPRTDLAYTVNYLEAGTNNVLAPAATVAGQTFGSTVTVNPIAIAGYATPAAQNITIAVTGNVINFYYAAIPVIPGNPVVDIPPIPPLPENIDDEITPLDGPEVTVDDPVNIDDEATPLAEGEHLCCILHFLILCAALLIELLYINDKKKRQQKIFEMRRELNK